METPDLIRGDTTRKSVRPYAARKGFAPAPPTLSVANNNNNKNNDDAKPNHTQLATSTRLPNRPQIDDNSATDGDAIVELRRPGVGAPLPRIAVSALPTLHAMPRQKPTSGFMTADDDVGVSFALGSIEKHINNVEESFRQQQLAEKQQHQSQSSMDVMKMEIMRKQSKRYGETENLLKPGISDMSSENDFQYLGGRRADLDSSNELMLNEFQRGSDGRNSIGAYSKKLSNGR